MLVGLFCCSVMQGFTVYLPHLIFKTTHQADFCVRKRGWGGIGHKVLSLGQVSDVLFQSLGLIHTGRARRKQMEPAVMDGSVHTARKQHQKICVRICVPVASHVLCE